jgi:PAS domain S-box-containing protein
MVGNTEREQSTPRVKGIGAAWPRFLLEDTPTGRRRLVLLLYAVLGPLFLGSLLAPGAAPIGPGPVGIVAALIASGALWVLVRTRPNVLDWIYTVAFVPTVCCGVAYAGSGGTGGVYLALLGAPLAGAAALFELPVGLAAIAIAILTVLVSLSHRMDAGAATISALLLAPIAAIFGWVIHASADQGRRVRRRLEELVQRDRALLRSLPDVLVRADRLGRVLDAHLPSKDGLPSPREDLIGRRLQDLVPGNVAERMREALARTFEVEAPQKVEYASHGQRGESFYEAHLHRSGPEEVTLIRRNVTERRRAEEERAFSSALLRRMQEAVITVDLELKVTSWMGGAERVYGWTAAEVIGKPVTSLLQPDLASADAAAYAANLAWRGEDRAVVRQRRKDGTAITIDSNVAALHDASGNVRGYLAVCRDVTAQKTAENALREREARLRAYFESPAVGIAMTSPKKGWMLVNDRVCSMLGYSREELSRMSWLEMTHPDDVAANVELFDQLLAGKIESYSLDKRFIRKDGTTAWTLVSASGVRGENRSLKYVVSIFLDIDRRKRVEDALRESERWLRLSQDIAQIGHYVYDVQRDHWTSSAALNSIFGIDESSPRRAADWTWIIHHEDREAMRAYFAELLASGSRFDREYRVTNQVTGAACWVHGLGELQRAPGGEPIRLVGTLQDVTARRTAEAERNALQGKLALAARLTAMGTLVAGVAHEINNPLAAGMAGQEHALQAARDVRNRLASRVDPAIIDHLLAGAIEALEDSQAAGRRIAQIVKDLAAFGRPSAEKTRVQLESVVQQAMRWAAAAVGHLVTVDVENHGAPDVLASSGQIEQVIVNLVTNAARATPEGTKGKIRIRIGTTPAGLASVEVVDQGAGMPPAILDRIFEPFFTTRPTGEGRGTGLGLAICHAVVAAHGGTITATSEVGQGSTFRVELPAANEDRRPES